MTSGTSAHRVTRPVAGVLICALALVAVVVAHRTPAAKHSARHVASLTATVPDQTGSTPRSDAAGQAAAPGIVAVLVAWHGTSDLPATLRSRTASYQQVRGPPADAAG